MLARLGDIVSLCFGARQDVGKEEFFFRVRLRLVVWRRDVVSVCATTLRDECFSEYIVRFRFLVSRGVVASPRSTGIRDELLSGDARSKPQRIR